MAYAYHASPATLVVQPGGGIGGKLAWVTITAKGDKKPSLGQPAPSSGTPKVAQVLNESWVDGVVCPQIVEFFRQQEANSSQIL